MSKTAFYFSTVQALNDDSIIVGAHLVIEGSSPTATLLIHICEGKWRLVAKIPDVINAMTIGRKVRNDQTVAVLGREGFFAEASVIKKALITETTVPGKNSGYLEDVVFYQGSYYVCGAHRQVHMFDSRVWARADQNIYSPANIPNEFLLSMHVDHHRIYACGAGGFAAYFESNSWMKLPLPTNVDLNTVFCATDGRVLFAGGGGLLFSLQPSGGWYEIASGLYPDVIFWDIEEFQGAIYLAAGAKVFKLVGQELEPIHLPFIRQIEVYSLSSSSKSLWLVGDEYVYQFTGERWIEHQSPSNS